MEYLRIMETHSTTRQTEQHQCGIMSEEGSASAESTNSSAMEAQSCSAMNTVITTRMNANSYSFSFLQFYARPSRSVDSTVFFRPASSSPSSSRIALPRRFGL